VGVPDLTNIHLKREWNDTFIQELLRGEEEEILMSITVPNGHRRRLACENALQLEVLRIVDKACLVAWTPDEVLLAIADTPDRALIDFTGDAPAPARLSNCPRAA
jgi:hypothetical protein